MESVERSMLGRRIAFDLNIDSDDECCVSETVRRKRNNAANTSDHNFHSGSAPFDRLRNFDIEFDDIKEEKTAINIPRFSQNNVGINVQFISECYVGFNSSSDDTSESKDSLYDNLVYYQAKHAKEHDSYGSDSFKFKKNAISEYDNDADFEAETSQMEKYAGMSHNLPEKYICDRCGKIYHRKYQLSKHLQFCVSRITSVAKNVCNACGKVFKLKWHLKKHFSVTHSDFKPFICTYCHKSYLYKSMLEQHLRIHLRLKPFKCDECPRSFSASSDLRKHLRRHKNPDYRTKNRESDLSKLEVCPLCFKHVVNVHVHMYTHTNYSNESLSCNVCNKRLKSLQALYAHVRLHSGDKFICDICQRQFNRKANMLAHKELHSKPSYKSKSYQIHLNKLL